MNFITYKPETFADVELGDTVCLVYIGRPCWIVTKPVPLYRVVGIGPKWITLSDNTKVLANGKGFFGIVKKQALHSIDTPLGFSETVVA